MIAHDQQPSLGDGAMSRSTSQAHISEPVTSPSCQVTPVVLWPPGTFALINCLSHLVIPTLWYIMM